MNCNYYFFFYAYGLLSKKKKSFHDSLALFVVETSVSSVNSSTISTWNRTDVHCMFKLNCFLQPPISYFVFYN